MKKKAKEAEEAEAIRKAAEVARIVIENEYIVRSDVRISVGAYLEGIIKTETGCNMMEVSYRNPAPDWFQDLLGSRKHHGNVKYLISDQLKAAIGHHSGSVITNYQFARWLWVYIFRSECRRIYP